MKSTEIKAKERKRDERKERKERTSKGSLRKEQNISYHKMA